MPKQVYKVEQFHGGLNNQADPRDIEDSQLSVATDVCVDEVGRIRPLGGIASHSTLHLVMIKMLVKLVVEGLELIFRVNIYFFKMEVLKLI